MAINNFVFFINIIISSSRIGNSVASGGIDIKVIVADSADESEIEAAGSMRHIITDEEMRSFRIGTSNDLFRSVDRYHGKWPTNAWVRSPASNGDWQDLYSRYGWGQVETVLVPESAEILDVTVTPRPIIFQTKEFKNKIENKATFNVKLGGQPVVNSVKMRWSKNIKLSFGEMVFYEFPRIGTETPYRFKAIWGSNKAILGSNVTVIQSITVGTETDVSMELKPGEKAVIELSANFGKMKARITYKAYLKGYVACNYYPRFKGSHFWGLPIGNVLGSGNKQRVVEDMEIGFYSNVKVKIENGQDI